MSSTWTRRISIRENDGPPAGGGKILHFVQDDTEGSVQDDTEESVQDDTEGEIPHGLSGRPWTLRPEKKKMR